MSKKKIDALCEGATEKEIVDKLRSKSFPHYEIETVDLKGMDNLEKKLRDMLDTFIENSKVIPELVTRVFVVLDLDDKEMSSRCDKVLTPVRQFDGTAKFEGTASGNVFNLKTALANFRLVVHLSNHRCEPSSIGYTTDDYVLNLALKQAIATHLLGKEKTKKSDWKMTPDQLLKKIREEIPDLLKRNGVPSLSAKQCLRLYAAIVAPKLSVPGFAGTVVEHSSSDDIQGVLASFLTAIEYLGSES